MSMTELRPDWLIGYYALRRDKFSAKTISVNNFSSEGVDQWQPECIQRKHEHGNARFMHQSDHFGMFFLLQQWSKLIKLGRLILTQRPSLGT